MTKLFLKVIVQWVAVAFALWLTVSLFSGITSDFGFFGFLWLAVLWGLVNVVIGIPFRLLALPLSILTLGFFSLIINTALLGLTAWLTKGLSIDGFWTAFFAALFLSIVNTVMTWIVDR